MSKETKRDLLDVAEAAARRRGFDGFSYADMARAVGIRKASIHYHFPTKADLSMALMDRYHVAMERACREIEAQKKTGGARLLALVDIYREASSNGQTLCLCVALTSSHESLSDDVNAKITEFRDMVIAWLAACFARAKEDRTITHVADPQLEAQSTLALLEGAHLLARAQEDVQGFDKAVALLKRRC